MKLKIGIPISMTWSAFQFRNYRLLFIGNASSQFGDHMQLVAQNWLVWQITGSVTALGLAAFVGMVPRLLFGFLGGPLVDKYNRRRLLGLTQFVALFFALSFSIAAVTENINYLLVLFFIFSLETTQIINQTTRQALLQELVPRINIPSAISLNATGNNLARILGPALGGILIPITGVAGLMFINTFTFLVIVIAVMLMKILPQSKNDLNQKSASFKEDLIKGYLYIWHNNRLRMLIYLGMISSLLIMPFTSLLVAYVDTILHKGPQFYGLLTAAFGIGGILGAMNSAAIRSNVGKTITILLAVLQGSTFLFLGLTSYPVLALIIMLLLGFATVTYNNSVVTAMQLTTSPDYMGRVMGIYLMNKAVTALGALLLGFASSLLGVNWAFVLSGALYLTFGAGVQYAKRELGAEAISPAVNKK